MRGPFRTGGIASAELKLLPVDFFAHNEPFALSLGRPRVPWLDTQPIQIFCALKMIGETRRPLALTDIGVAT